MKENIAILTISFFIIGNCLTQSFNSLDESTQNAIDSLYENLLTKSKTVGLSIAIIDSGRIVYSTGYGFYDKSINGAADDQTVYRIGSITKSFTALSLMQLQEKGLIDVNDSFKKHFPELTISSRFNDDNPLLIHEMMTHLSGLPSDVYNGFFCDSPPDMNWLIQELNKQTTIHPKRYLHAYSNVAYGLLGELIAKKSNVPYSQYLKENIFKPLKMNSSFVDYNDTLIVNFSKGYIAKKEINEPLIRDQAAGLVHSNVIDMSHYIQFFLDSGVFDNQQIVSKKSIEEMMKNQTQNTILDENKNWGFGLYTKKILLTSETDSAEVSFVGHGGDTFAYHAEFGFIPEKKIGVVILTNTDSGISINSPMVLLKLYLEKSQKRM
jgi:CubicO group peptidase (beta-lactamase class C family)